MPARKFVSLLHDNISFLDYFTSLPNLHEAHEVVLASALMHRQRLSGWQDEIAQRCSQAKVVSIFDGHNPTSLQSLPDDWQWLISTNGIPGYDPGTVYIPNESSIPFRNDSKLPVRLIAVPISARTNFPAQEAKINSTKQEVGTVDLYQLGILEEDNLESDQVYPHTNGHGELKETLAVCQTLALTQKVPFRSDSLTKILEDQFRRGKSVTLELIASMCEILGLSSQIGTTNKNYLRGVEGPAIFIYNDVPIVYFGVKNNKVIISHPNSIEIYPL